MIEKYRGQQFGNYRLIRLLDQGGFADVYLGKHIHINKEAAIKVLNTQLRGDDIKQFRDEADIIARLEHANIVSLLDFGVENGTPFLVMKYAPNGSLRKKHAKGEQVSLDMVVSYVKQAAQALQYAHDNKVIHRDVKPDNLLLDERNNVLLSDFGIATAIRTTTSDPTQGIAGTYAYMSPEQLIGRPCFASDQYSLAIMVYEWLCGELPFSGREPAHWLYQHQRVPPPPLHGRVPSLPADVEAVIFKALAKKPEDRFPRIEDFAIYLEQAATGKRLFPPPLNRTEQLIQEAIQAEIHGELATAYYLYREIANTPDAPSHYIEVAQNGMQKLRPQIAPFIRKQTGVIRQRARKAVLQGRWQDEIHAWKELLTLNPSEQEIGSPLTLGTSNYYIGIKKRIQERIDIAQQNEQWARMYANAEKRLRGQEEATACELLKIIWDKAPYYGDPAGLAKELGLPPPMNYEQALDEEESRIAEEESRIAEEKRRKQALEDQARKQERKKNITAISLTIMSIISSIIAAITSINVIHISQIFIIITIIIGMVLGISLTIVCLKHGVSRDTPIATALYSSLIIIAFILVSSPVVVQLAFAVLTVVIATAVAKEKSLLVWGTLFGVGLLEPLIVFSLAFVGGLFLFSNMSFSKAVALLVVILGTATIIVAAVVVGTTAVAIMKDSK